LNASDYDQYQSSNVRLRQAGTGGWFLDGTEFKHWLSVADGKLWLYGIRKSAIASVWRVVINNNVQLERARLY
jgi:hypothetical protein